MDDIPADVLEDCAQLVKNNSIQGNIKQAFITPLTQRLTFFFIFWPKGVKEQTVTVIYTPWSNLKKTQGMEAGAVSFFDQKLVRKLKIEKKKEIVKAVEKTRTEKQVDLRGIARANICFFLTLNLPACPAQRDEYDRQLRAEEKKRKEDQVSP